MTGQRGFSLAEVLVSAAIAFTVGAALVWLVHATLLAAAHLDERLRARDALERLEDRLNAETTAAWSVFVPAQDVRGNPNADGHELDFASEDASHRSYWRAYRFDASASTLTVFSYAPGSAPAAGDVYQGITGFIAETHALSDLGDAASDAYDPLFAGDALVPVDVPFNWGGRAIGGNHLVRLHVTAAGIDRTLMLASGTAPSHFTVIVEYTPPPPTPTP